MAAGTEPLRTDYLLVTKKSPETPRTHLIHLRNIKGWVDHETTKWFSTRDLCIGNPSPEPLVDSSRISSFKNKKLSYFLVGRLEETTTKDMIILIHHAILIKY